MNVKLRIKRKEKGAGRRPEERALRLARPAEIKPLSRDTLIEVTLEEAIRYLGLEASEIRARGLELNTVSLVNEKFRMVRNKKNVQNKSKKEFKY